MQTTFNDIDLGTHELVYWLIWTLQSRYHIMSEYIFDVLWFVWAVSVDAICNNTACPKIHVCGCAGPFELLRRYPTNSRQKFHTVYWIWQIVV